MNKILLFSLLLLFPGALGAQTITFCNNLTPEEQCKDNPKSFYLPGGGTGAGIFAVVRLLEEVNVKKVIYKLYRFDEEDQEVYMTSLTQDIMPHWKTFWKQIVFNRESGYKVYLYTDSGKLLSSSEISVLEDFE